METISKFIHQVSKGSRFNQIYIPREKEKEFGVGDTVEVRLIKKDNKLHYSKHLKKLSEFKESLISQIFSFLSKYKEIKQVFIFGSFLTKKIDYKDIDVLIFLDEELKGFDERIYKIITDKFNLNIHIISVKIDRFKETLKICPISRGMLYHNISNKIFSMPIETTVNENHLRYLLMMPEDLLRIRLPLGKVYYNSLRKLITIEHFLKKEEIAPDKIDLELVKLIDDEKLLILKEDKSVETPLLKELREIIKNKLIIIYKLIKNGKK